MIRFVIAVFVVHLCLSSTAQHKPTGATAKQDAAPWQYSLYPGNIIKTTFTLQGQSPALQISNAVIEKPLTDKAEKFIQFLDGSTRYVVDESAATLLRYFEAGGFRGFQFSLSEGEKIYGAGERSVPLDRRGYRLNLYNNPQYGYELNADNLNYSVPFILSNKGYGIFFDNPSRGYLDIGKTDPNILEWGVSSGELTYYIIPGKNAEEIIRKYQLLVGTQPMPARWVFGNLMSRFGYRSEKQLMGIVDSMHKQDIPLDAVILDLFWFGDSIKGTMGNLAWTNHTAWPNPARMINTLKNQHINTILIAEPFVLKTTPNYAESRKYLAVDSSNKPFLLTDFYFGQGGLIDIFRKDAQNWFWSKYKPQIMKGVAGWWGDLGEPEKHPQGVYHNLHDFGFHKLFRADEVHNIFGHYWDKMLFDKYATEYPKTRLFNLNRSGYAGSARYGVFPWSGDVSRTWGGLQAQLPVMLGMSMSGVPYIHADAGGFAGGSGDMELYTRWLQFAVFTPVLRPHGTALGDLDATVKNIPSEAALYPDPYRSIVRNYIQLRYKLLPYNYTLGYDQAKFGKPLVRPLFYFGGFDAELYNATDEFMWGDELLVAPVLEKEATHRKLYLPAGNWYNLFTDSQEPGGTWLDTKVDLTNIPVFVKEGSFIPMFESEHIKSTFDYTGKEISIKYYPSLTESSYVLFDDDGVTNHSLTNGKYDLLKLEGLTKAGEITIKISSPQNGLLKSRKLKFSLPEPFRIISVNNKILTGTNNQYSLMYSGKTTTLKIMVR